MRGAVDVAPVRAEPRDDAEQVTQALRGEPLRVEGRRNGWVRVVTAYDYPGWVHEDALEETITWYRERDAGQVAAPGSRQPLPLRVAGGILRRAGLG